MISIYKFSEIFKQLKDGDTITFVKENDDNIKMEIIDKKTDTYKITYRGRSILNNIPIQEYYFQNTIRIKVNEEDITKELEV